MMVRKFSAVSAVFALMISMCISPPLLAGDAQTANKPKDMVTLVSSGLPGQCGAYWYAFSARLNDDFTVTPFTIPAGYKFIVTHSTGNASIAVSGVRWPSITQGLNVDVAVAPNQTICFAGENAVVHGHLEKDIP